MTLPLRMVQASATAAAEQPCAAPIRASVGSRSKLGAGAAERRIGHHRHAVLLAPWQQVTFNAAVADIVRDLISRAAIALWNTKELFHVTDIEVGHAPSANLPAERNFSNAVTTAERSVTPLRPMQQIEIEIISTETS